MKKPLSLPLAVRVAPPPPTIDEARAKLGGRAESGPRAGEVVDVDGAAGSMGVVVFALDDEAWVWIGEGRLKKCSATTLVAHAGEPPRELSRVAADVRVFASLREGARVRYVADAAEMREGTLAEKCRFGGLVTTASGTVVAVAFRRLWPAATDAA